MPTNTNVSSQSFGVPNLAQGSIVTTSASAAAVTLTAGFIPRVIRFRNVTDRISDEWYAGIDEEAIYTAILGITAKLDSDGGITPTDFASTCNPASASLADLNTSLLAINAKLDGAVGVTDTNYAALWDPATATFADFKASINGMTAKLDADAGVTDTDYASTWATTAAVSLHTVANGTVTFEKVNGILNNLDGTFTLNATAMAASKVFCWEALG
jgi:hypothetical protein